MADQWFVVRTHPGHERSASEQISSLGHVTYSPMYSTANGFWPRGQRSTPVFPSYVFTEFDFNTDDWEKINDQRHVVRLMPFHVPWPSPIPVSFVDDLRSREDAGDFQVRLPGGSLRLKYRPGDKVPIVAGAWAGLHAEFIEQVKDNVKLLTRLFGQEREVLFPVDQVAPNV